MASGKYFPKLLVFVLLMGFTTPTSAQNMDEWTKQKKTQRKYLIGQIIALHVHADKLTKGYAIVRNGWNTIEGITGGDFDLHRDFFVALGAVSPFVSNDYRVTGIMRLQNQMLNSSRNTYRQLQGEGQLQTFGLQYVDLLHKGILGQSNGLMDELLLVLSSDHFVMDDADRLERLENIYRSMQHLFMVQNAFDRQVLIYSQKLKINKQNLQRLENLHYDN